MFGVAVELQSCTLYFCSIECCRHMGFEPTRMLLPSEYDNGCAHCDTEPCVP